MLSTALEYFIGVSLPSGYEPLQYLVEVFILVFLLSEFYKMIRMILNK